MADLTNERPEINAVLEHYGVLTKDRHSYMTRCAFPEEHANDDRTPSMSVNTDRQLFNCKSCGKAGDSYTLIEMKEQTDFRGACTFAATLGFAAGDAGGGDSDIRSGYLGPRRKRPDGKRHNRSDGAYVPRWRRD